MKTSSMLIKVITVTTTILVVAAFFLAQATPALADDPYLDANIPTSGMSNKDIEYMNQHEITWLVAQNKIFKAGHTVEDYYTNLSAIQLKRHGTTSGIEILVGTYDTSLVKAEAVQLEAAKIIGAQSGFDAQGHVTNRDWALQTVTNGRESLRNARYQLLMAIHVLQHDYHDWRNKFINHIK